MATDFTLHRRAQDCILGTYLTNSKRPESFVKGVYPTHIKRGQGAFLWDHRGKKYLDFCGGLGTNLLGYGHDRVNAAISAQLSHGYSHSFATHLEIEVAEKAKELFPFCSHFKFLKTGTEACAAAIRIARARMGRWTVLTHGYHGWSDEFVRLTPPALGVPEGGEHWRDWPYMEPCAETYDLGSPMDLRHVAAVIIEPILTDTSPERVAWLNKLRDDCTRAEVLLIFDEVVTGFRFPKFSASSYFGITPDIIILGKAIANGMPLAAIGVTPQVARDMPDFFVSSTYAGETLSLAAAKETMSLLQTQYDIAWLWANGQRFLDEFNSLLPEQLTIDGYPSRGAFRGDPLTKGLFFQEACKAGMLFGPSYWMNFPSIDESRNAMISIRAIMERIKRGEVKLEGELPQSPFAQRVREAQ